MPVFDDVVLVSSDERRTTHLMKAVGMAKTQMGQLFAIWRVNSPGKASAVGRYVSRACAHKSFVQYSTMHVYRGTCGVRRSSLNVDAACPTRSGASYDL